jgi:DNA polymerase III subunit epsilon
MGIGRFRIRSATRFKRDPSAIRFEQGGRPRRSTPWREAGWCAIDLELTGLGPDDEIIAIGAVGIQGGRVLLGESLYTLARPARPPQRGAVLVHKLRAADLEQAPPLSEGIELLLTALCGRTPVFHTAAIESSFLGRELRRRRARLPAGADTEALGRIWLARRDGYPPSRLTLAKLAAALGQPAEAPHHALGDALTTAKAFIALASHLDATRPQTVGSILDASQPPRPARRFGPL